MSQEYLDFELPIAELEAKIEALRSASDDKIDLHDEIKRLQKKSDELTKKTFANLDASLLKANNGILFCYVI